MPRIVSPWKIRRARTLITQRRLTIREIAMTTGLSKSLVGKLAAGSLPRLRNKPLNPKQVSPYLCECGRMVNLRPCVICAAEAATKRLSTKAVAAGPG